MTKKTVELDLLQARRLSNLMKGAQNMLSVQTGINVEANFGSTATREINGFSTILMQTCSYFFQKILLRLHQALIF